MIAAQIFGVSPATLLEVIQLLIEKFEPRFVDH